MYCKNITGNSIYIEDLDFHITYDSNEVVFISSDDIKKSESLQKMLVMGAFDILSISDERIEKNILRLREKYMEKHKENEEKNLNENTENTENKNDFSDDLDVVIRGHFYEAGGYAKVNRNLALGLNKIGVNVEISPVTTKRNDLNEMEVRALSALTKKVSSKAIRIDSIIPSFSDISPRYSYRILYTTIEAATIPQQTVDICNRYDEIWVTSDFCKEILSKYNVKPNIYVFPPSINMSLYNENVKMHFFTPEPKKFVFLSVFGWSYRKGYDVLLKSYLKEFSGSDDVSLLIVSRFQGSSERSKIIQTEIKDYIEKYGGNNPAHIIRCSRVIPEFEMPKIYKACDAFVLPSRGEGFSLTVCEASLCGIPVITTNYSGQTMFLNNQNSFPVDIDNLEKLPKGKMHVHYWDGELFPSLNSDDFIVRLGKTMRNVYENYEEAKSKNNILKNELKSGYSITFMSEKIKQRLLYIKNELIKKG